MRRPAKQASAKAETDRYCRSSYSTSGGQEHRSSIIFTQVTFIQVTTKQALALTRQRCFNIRNCKKYLDYTVKVTHSYMSSFEWVISGYNPYQEQTNTFWYFLMNNCDKLKVPVIRSFTAFTDTGVTVINVP